MMLVNMLNIDELFLIELVRGDVSFSLVHSDLCDMSPITFVRGVRWFIIFVDDCT